MYNYQTERPKILTDEGQRNFLKVRDHVHALLKKSGACDMGSAMSAVTEDSWTMMAYVDRLVELEEIVEIPQPHCAGQHRIFVPYTR
jgi:hypothetical protein